MLTGQFAPISAVFIGLALTTSGLGHASRVDLSMVRARRYVFVFLFFGTVTLAL
ncbi:hypothetical protein ACH9L7_18220 (plasmid) [Haloferax sp. S1W]|uniref:hypothetical protein n=1 Tax=Haloferax sp. S1W TaxID=3377110 RepID=UPI0037C72CE2